MTSFQQYQMFEIGLTIFLLLTVSLIYFCWIKPQKQRKFYINQIRALGYSVLQIPFNPITVDMISAFRRGIKLGDAIIEYKQIRSNYDVVVGNALLIPRLEINHPDFIKSYFAIDKHYEYPKSEKVVNIFSRLAGKGLPFSQGEVWRRKRNILNKVFNFDFIKAQTDKIASLCADSIKNVQKQSKSYPEENLVEYDILNLTVRMFSGVMMEIFLGGTKEQKIGNIQAGQFVKTLMSDITSQAFQPLNAILGPSFSKLGITPEQRRINRNAQTFRKWGINFIKNRVSEIQSNLKNNPNKKVPEDIIEALIMSRKNTSSQNTLQETITQEKQIFEQFASFFAAGTDTTSNYTQMMIYMMGCHPQVEKKVREEIQKYMKQQKYSYENLKNLKYLDNVQKQITRCFGPGTQLFSRIANQDNFLNGMAVKKGTRLSVIAMSNHYNPKYFKNPKQFRPERWESECDNLPNFVFGGFSGGARTCIGKHLALIQSKIALIKFLKRYNKITLPNKNFKMTFKFVYSPENFLTKMEINKEFKL